MCGVFFIVFVVWWNKIVPLTNLILVVGARNIQINNKTSVDAFCTVDVSQQTFKTEVQHGNTPVWNHEIEWYGSEGIGESERV